MIRAQSAPVDISSRRQTNGHRGRCSHDRVIASWDTEEQWYQTPGYKVAGKGFLRFRTEAEGGLVVFVSDLGEKEALLTSNPAAFFTTPHYEGWPIVLVNLDEVDHDELRELITDSWLIKAPPRLRRRLEAQ